MKSNITLIFEKGIDEELHNYTPEMDIEVVNLKEIIPQALLRNDIPLPNVPEIEIFRHFVKLSNKNYGVDTGIYPLG